MSCVSYDCDVANTYWRVTFKAANGKNRHVWAKNYNDGGGNAGLARITFTVVNAEGEEGDPRELVVASLSDIKNLRVARMNNTYAMLEVVK